LHFLFVNLPRQHFVFLQVKKNEARTLLVFKCFFENHFLKKYQAFIK
jgi:hypothetical protein